MPVPRTRRGRRQTIRPKTDAELRADYERKLARMAAINARRKARVPLYRYAKVLAAVRADTEHQGQKALIATFTKGVKPENSRLSKSEAISARRWLDRNYPTEDWDIGPCKIPETWGEYGITAAFFGAYPNRTQFTINRKKRLKARLRG